MLYLEKVIMMHSYKAGFLMLLGQVTDAISTPLIGLLSDASVLPSFLMKYGRRKAWHIIGSELIVNLVIPYLLQAQFASHSLFRLFLLIVYYVVQMDPNHGKYFGSLRLLCCFSSDGRQRKSHIWL
jgi:Na+/melibiose symporter-like transporter